MKGEVWKMLFVLSMLSVLFLFLIGDNFNNQTKNLMWYCLTNQSRRQIDKGTRNVAHNLLDDCYHVYLDVGSNVGIQVRKLYEPHLYSQSEVLSVFNAFFGDIRERNLSRICSVGFEPNPNHEARLKQLEVAYQRCGWRVIFFTRTAVGGRENVTAFFHSDGDTEYLEWGGSVSREISSLGQVRLARLSKFILDVVATRRLPATDSHPDKMTPAVLLKLDIEGSERETIPDLILTGASNFITKSMIELHTVEELDKSKFLNTEAILKFCGHQINFDFNYMDDEEYGTSNFSLPSCN